MARPRPTADPARYSRRRAAVLIGVHLLIALHIAHWLVARRTLAPLEFNEVMYTLELGVVTAGFILMALAALSVAFFGRFFCSWACHMLALQDLSAWLLARFGVQAKPVRSRALRVTPFAAMFYMFLWPQITRLWSGEPLPTLHVESTTDPWASFVTDDFWRNLPGPWITGLTFLICGAAIVYLLGSRAFCANACPYGAVFSLLDRIAPGRIVLKGDCTSCAQCTAVCQSGVSVHEEVQLYGKVVDPACLKDLDCVAVCPEAALGYGIRSTASFSSRSQKHHRSRGYHLSLREDVVAGIVLVSSVLVFRGLYATVPFLLSLGLGGVLAWVAVVNLRMWRSGHTVLRGITLRRNDRITRHGCGFATASALLLALMLHSAVVRYHEYFGNACLETARSAVARRDVDEVLRVVPLAIEHLEACERWGLFNPVQLNRQLASIHSIGPTPMRAEFHFDRVLARDPGDHSARVRRALLLIRAGRPDEAELDLRQVDEFLDNGAAIDARAELVDGSVAAHTRLAALREQQGRAADANAHRQSAEHLAEGSSSR